MNSDERQPPTDAALVADVLEGETERFGELVERYKNLVASYIAARVPADEVDDLAQEVFLRAFRGLPSLRDPAAFSSWLLGIANHVCIDWHRSRDRLPSLDPEVAVSAESVAPHRPRPSQPHEKVERQEAARLLLESLDQLPETYRVTLVLKHMEGLSCAQIAARLDVALGTVTSRLARGYKLLRAKLERTADATRMPSE